MRTKSLSQVRPPPGTHLTVATAYSTPVPVTWRFVGSVLVVATEGDYAKEQLEEAVALAMADEQFRPGTTLLFDGRLSTAVPSSADVQWRVHWVSTLLRRGFSRRIGIIARDEAFRIGIGRQISASVESRGVEMRIFKDEDSALTWIAANP
jgi:hypothetical protein